MSTNEIIVICYKDKNGKTQTWCKGEPLPLEILTFMTIKKDK